jgi:hypothetical protein
MCVDTANEGDASQLAPRVDARVHRIQVAACRRVIAHDGRDLNEVRGIDIDHDHVVQHRDARSVAERLGKLIAHGHEVDRWARSTQYQLSAFFFHA